jgi:hypothetical protein
LLSHALNDLLKDAFLDIQPGTRTTNLSLIKEDGIRGSCNGGLNICVAEHNVGRLATQFQWDFFEVAWGCLENKFPNFRWASEGNLINICVEPPSSGVLREKSTVRLSENEGRSKEESNLLNNDLAVTMKRFSQYNSNTVTQ